VILPKERDPRFITVRRGGTLSDPDHHLLAIWAADCAQHVPHHFEQAQPGDDRPRRALDLARAWARGGIPMKEAHVAAHELGAAAYAIRDLVLDDQRLRNALCWNVFDCQAAVHWTRMSCSLNFRTRPSGSNKILSSLICVPVSAMRPTRGTYFTSRAALPSYR